HDPLKGVTEPLAREEVRYHEQPGVAHEKLPGGCAEDPEHGHGERARAEDEHAERVLEEPDHEAQTRGPSDPQVTSSDQERDRHEVRRAPAEPEHDMQREVQDHEQRHHDPSDRPESHRSVPSVRIPAESGLVGAGLAGAGLRSVAVSGTAAAGASSASPAPEGTAIRRPERAVSAVTPLEPGLIPAESGGSLDAESGRGHAISGPSPTATSTWVTEAG